MFLNLIFINFYVYDFVPRNISLYLIYKAYTRKQTASASTQLRVFKFKSKKNIKTHET